MTRLGRQQWAAMPPGPANDNNPGAGLRRRINSGEMPALGVDGGTDPNPTPWVAPTLRVGIDPGFAVDTPPVNDPGFGVDVPDVNDHGFLEPAVPIYDVFKARVSGGPAKVTALYVNGERVGILPDVVALTGPAGCGKSTAADHLVKNYGYVRVRFAAPLKAMMAALGLSEAQIEGDLKGDPAAILNGATPRHAMQTLGTEWGRDLISPNLWTSLWERTARDVLDHGGRVVCDDYRFPNEGDVLVRYQALRLKVTGRGGISGGHVSESHNLPFDRIIDNTGDLFWLQLQVAEALMQHEMVSVAA